MSRFVLLGVFVVAAGYGTLIFALHPGGRLGDPPVAPSLNRLVYDDYDLTAYAIRGLNAELGLRAGRKDDPCAAGASAHPAREHADDCYYLEYPHAALWVFRFPFRVVAFPVAGPLAPTVGQTCHNRIVEHEPQGDSARALWSGLARAVAWYRLFDLACLLGLMITLYWGYGHGEGVAPIWLLLLPATLYFALNRFDVLPAFLTALGFACLGRQRLVGSALFLAAATLVKVYPILFAPILLRFLLPKRRDALVWLATYAACIFGCIAVQVAWEGAEAVAAPYRVQIGRTLEAVTYYGHFLPISLGGDSAWARFGRLGVVSIAMILTCWTTPRDLPDFLRRCAIVLLVFVSVQVFYSPQWIIWLCPLVLPLVSHRKALRYAWVGLDLVTYVTFPVVFDLPHYPHQDLLLSGLIYLRAAATVLLLFLLARSLRIGQG
jgi:hypothetical protein